MCCGLPPSKLFCFFWAIKRLSQNAIFLRIDAFMHSLSHSGVFPQIVSPWCRFCFLWDSFFFSFLVIFRGQFWSHWKLCSGLTYWMYVYCAPYWEQGFMYHRQKGVELFLKENCVFLEVWGLQHFNYFLILLLTLSHSPHFLWSSSTWSMALHKFTHLILKTHLCGMCYY